MLIWHLHRVNGTQVEDKMRTFKGECAQFRFNKCPIYTHDGASAKFSTNSQETDYSVCKPNVLYTLYHKVRTYKEYHSVCPSSELGLSQPLSRQRVFPSPQKPGGGGTLACGWGLGGVPIPTRGIHCGTLYMYVLCALYRMCSLKREALKPWRCLAFLLCLTQS